MMFLFLILIIGLIYYTKTGNGLGSIVTRLDHPTVNAESILAERFAKGEIDESTYVSMKQKLK